MNTPARPVKINPTAGEKKFQSGLLLLFLDICLSVAAQLLLKAGMREIGAFELRADWWAYFLQLIHPLILVGLFLYGLATVIWIICLTKLDLSFAYPVATVQYFLIFLGAWHLFGEHIAWNRLVGIIIIFIGVIIISSDKQTT
jgi:drug/metabolite transporter (DMT)-like permease